jgi:hypothetical protein
MRIGLVSIPSVSESGPNVVEHVTAIAPQVEALGFRGLWVTDGHRRRPADRSVQRSDAARGDRRAWQMG